MTIPHITAENITSPTVKKISIALCQLNIEVEVFTGSDMEVSYKILRVWFFVVPTLKRGKLEKGAEITTPYKKLARIGITA